MDKKHLLSFGIKYDMAAGFFYKRYRKGTKWRVSGVMKPYKSPFYQHFRNLEENNVYNVYVPMFIILLETGLRCYIHGKGTSTDSDR